jgi:hypothetical protein
MAMRRTGAARSSRQRRRTDEFHPHVHRMHVVCPACAQPLRITSTGDLSCLRFLQTLLMVGWSWLVATRGARGPACPVGGVNVRCAQWGGGVGRGMYCSSESTGGRAARDAGGARRNMQCPGCLDANECPFAFGHTLCPKAHHPAARPMAPYLAAWSPPQPRGAGGTQRGGGSSGGHWRQSRQSSRGGEVDGLAGASKLAAAGVATAGAKPRRCMAGGASAEARWTLGRSRPGGRDQHCLSVHTCAGLAASGRELSME